MTSYTQIEKILEDHTVALKRLMLVVDRMAAVRTALDRKLTSTENIDESQKKN